MPAGQAFDHSGALSETIAGHVPLRLDVGYRFGRHVYVGVAGQLGLIVARACPGGERCTGTNARVGVLVAYHALPTRVVDPWIGLGTGFEILHVSRSASGAAVDVTARGIELIDLELGADVRASRVLRLGPVLSTSIGRYTSVRVNEVSTDDFVPALHAWIMLGFRGAFDL